MFCREFARNVTDFMLEILEDFAEMSRIGERKDWKEYRNFTGFIGGVAVIQIGGRRTVQEVSEAFYMKYYRLS